MIVMLHAYKNKTNMYATLAVNNYYQQQDVARGF